LGAASSVTACIIGIGLLTLPKLFARAGWIGGACILGGVAVFLLQLVLFLARAVLAASAAGKPVTTYRGLADWSLGKSGGWILAIVMYVEYALFLSLLILSLSEQVTKIFVGLEKSPIVSVIISTAVVSPSCLVSNARLLGYFSVIGLTGTAMLSGLVIVKGFIEAKETRQTTSLFEFSAYPWALSVSNLCLVFAASGIVPTIMAGMKDPEKFPRVAKIVFAVTTAFYLTIACSGYSGWGVGVDAVNPVTSLPGTLLEKLQDGSWSHVPTMVAMVLLTIPNYAISALVLNNGLDELISKRYLHVPVRMAVLVAEAVVAYLFNESLGALLDIISACTCVILVWVFPVLIHWALRYKNGKATTFDHVFTATSLVVGAVIIVVGTQAAFDAFIKNVLKV